MSVKNKKKNKSSIFDRKNILVTAMAAVVVVLVALVMSMFIPKEEEESFETRAWTQAVEEAEKGINKRIEQDSGLNEVAGHEAVQTNAEAYPANAEEQGASAPNTATYSKPIENGTVQKEYSGDELVYSETMQDWRTHNGIDYLAEVGTDVLASSDGTVEAITENSMMGTTVIILHGGGVRTIYSNLDENLSLNIGDTVAKGGIIGKVGNTASAEATEQPHLHFEMSVNEEIVNPNDYLAK